MKVGVLATMIFGALIGYPIASFAGLAPDTDSDGVPDVLDNCKFVANAAPANCDGDTDGVGNRCDCDVNGTGNGLSCTGSDFTQFRTEFNAGGTNYAADTNMNCNTSGAVYSGTDFTLFRSVFNAPALRGSGLSCAGTVGCN